MPKVEKNQDLSLQDIRVIIHGLKMSGFATIEPEALDQIKFRIKALPSAEELNGLTDDPQSLKRIAQEIGEIMRLLEIYGKKGPEFKARFESLKGLPPRYKVLEWRKANMKNTNFARQLVRISSVADQKGQTELAEKMLSFAKKAIDEKFTEKDVKEASSLLAHNGLEKDAKLVEAGFKGLWEGVKSGWQRDYPQQIAKALNQAIAKFEQSMDTGVLLQETESLQKWVKKIEGMVPGEGKAPAQKFLAYIQQLQKSANELNAKLMNDAQTFITQQKQGIASIAGGTAATTPTTPEIPEAAGGTPETATTPASPAAAPEAPATGGTGATGATGATAPSGFPNVTAPDQAARWADFIQKSMGATARSKNRIVIAQSEDVALRQWWDANKGNKEAINQALTYLQGIAKGSTAPRGVPETSLLGSDVGTAPAAKPADKAAPATTPTPDPAAPTAPAAAPATGSGDPKADEYLKGLKKEPGNADVYVDGTGARVKIVPAAQYILRRIV